MTFLSWCFIMLNPEKRRLAVNEQSPHRHILDDARVWLGSSPLGKSRAFKEFIELEVPTIVEDYEDEILTFALLLEIRHNIASTWAYWVPSEQNRNIAQSLASHRDVHTFLALHATTEAGYCLQMRGLSNKEYAQMQQGVLTVSELYRQNPIAFLGPLLPKNKFMEN